jgi:hypothetical protein
VTCVFASDGVRLATCIFGDFQRYHDASEGDPGIHDSVQCG